MLTNKAVSLKRTLAAINAPIYKSQTNNKSLNNIKIRSYSKNRHNKLDLLSKCFNRSLHGRVLLNLRHSIKEADHKAKMIKLPSIRNNLVFNHEKRDRADKSITNDISVKRNRDKSLSITRDLGSSFTEIVRYKVERQNREAKTRREYNKSKQRMKRKNSVSIDAKYLKSLTGRHLNKKPEKVRQSVRTRNSMQKYWSKKEISKRVVRESKIKLKQQKQTILDQLRDRQLIKLSGLFKAKRQACLSITLSLLASKPHFEFKLKRRGKENSITQKESKKTSLNSKRKLDTRSRLVNKLLRIMSRDDKQLSGLLNNKINIAYSRRLGFIETRK